MSYIFKDVWAPAVDFSAGTPAGYYFGLNEIGGKRPLNLRASISANYIEDIAVRYPTMTKGNHPLDSLSGSFYLVNGLPIYWMLGLAAVNGEAAGWDISPLTTGYKPEIHAGLDSNSDLRYYAHDLTMRSLDLRYRRGEPIYAQCDWVGKAHGNSGATSITASYADSVSGVFDEFSLCTWDEGGDGGAETLHIDEIAIQYRQQLTPIMGSSGIYAYIGQSTPIVAGVTINFKRDFDIHGSTTLWADTWAGNTGDLRFKITKGTDTTKYLDFVFNDILCINVNGQRIDGEPPQYFASFAGGQPTCDATDGITTASLYGL